MPVIDPAFVFRETSMKPQFILLGLVAVLGIAAFAYWVLSSDSDPNSNSDSEGTVPSKGEALPPRLESLTQPSSQRPGWKAIENVVPEDRESLEDVYRREPSLQNKRQITWALAMIGDGDTAKLLRGSLLEDYDNQNIPENAEDVLVDTCLVLGFLARQDPETFTFLIEGTKPEFWEDVKTWNSTRGDFGTHKLIASCIQAIGLSEHPRTQDELRRLQSMPREYRHEFYGDIVQAAYYASMKRNPEDFERAFWSKAGLTSFLEWRETPEGAKWKEWAEAQKKI